MDSKMVDRERMKKAEVGFRNEHVLEPQKGEIVYLTEMGWEIRDEGHKRFIPWYIED